MGVGWPRHTVLGLGLPETSDDTWNVRGVLFGRLGQERGKAGLSEVVVGGEGVGESLVAHHDERQPAQRKAKDQEPDEDNHSGLA